MGKGREAARGNTRQGQGATSSDSIRVGIKGRSFGRLELRTIITYAQREMGGIQLW